MGTKVEITENELVRILNPKDWEHSSTRDRMFTSNHIIEAYQEGKSVGLDEYRKQLSDELSANIDSAGIFTKKVVSYLKKEIGFVPISAHLKINDIQDFQVLVFLNTKDFATEKMFSVYSKISEKEKKASTEAFKIHTSFGNTQGTINSDVLVSDGYSLHFKM